MSKTHTVLASDLQALLGDTSKSTTFVSSRDFRRIQQNASSHHKKEEMSATLVKKKVSTRNELVKARAEKLMRADKVRRVAQPTTFTEQQAARRSQAARIAAQSAKDQEEPLVKKMNSLALNARVFTVRDRQLLAQRRKEEIKRQEILEDRQRADEAHKRYLAQQKKEIHGRQVVQARRAADMREQLEALQEARILEEAARTEEAARMKVKQRELLEKEERVKREEEERQQHLREEADIINKAALKARAQRQARERDEDLRIAAFLREQESKAASVEENERLLERQRNLDFAKQADVARSSANKFEERERLRLLRVREEDSRAQRAKDMEAGRKNAEMLRSLEDAREANRRAKAEEKARADAQRLTDLQNAKDKLAAEHADRDARLRRQHMMKLETRRVLDQQLQLKQQMARETRESTAPLRQARKQRESRFEELRNAKLSQLRSLGVEEKYLVPLKNMAFEEE
eukprot:gnl/Dysnectes_brevis/4871_a6756_356.p1 GENE.gnl/Dysnectes_brevis/4871_a6756_356~~gnl/Dysnectes_brevis/4871_a6756_356.p1  ORF type:complete len:464 (-),score=199.65 gnl/Dysnectes_brevis/4871_a6756_356:44-1435(-)